MAPDDTCHSNSEQILVEPSRLHDGRQMPSLVLKQLEIGYRVAVHEEQVGDGTGLDDAEPTRHADDLGADEGRRANGVQRAHHFGAQQKLPRLLLLQLTQEVTAEADLDARLAANLE
jgi:hypothetical protein